MIAARLLSAALLSMWAAPAALAADPVPQAEEVDVATLAPAGPHRLFVTDSWTTGNTRVIEGDDAHFTGILPHPPYSNFAIVPGGRLLVIAESIWSKGSRGTRQDMVSLYDPQSLALLAEIALPGRIITGDKPQMLGISADGRLAYIYDMSPANIVHIVDLVARKRVADVETAGCALIFPYGVHSFASLCADGALARVTLDRAFKATQTRSDPLFDPENDPIIDQADLDPAGRGFFVAYSGLIYPVDLAASAPLGAGYSIQQAAGLPVAGMRPGDVAWRPGGRQVSALHRATGKLYVLMHPGEIWTHNQAGTELWVLDTATRTVVRRIALKEPASNVAVSQDAAPLVFLNQDNRVIVLDPATGKELRRIDAVGSGAMTVATAAAVVGKAR